jgi:hypothetical protein
MQESMVQGLLSSQSCGTPEVQSPSLQTSSVVHGLDPAHGVPFGAGAWMQPVAELQESTVHGSRSLQLSAGPDEHSATREPMTPVAVQVTVIHASDTPQS